MSNIAAETSRVAEQAQGVLLGVWDAELFSIGAAVVTTGRVVGALATVAAALLLAWLSGRALRRFESRNDGVNRASVYALGRLVRYVFIAIGIVLALEWLGVDAGKFTVVAGALGVGLGFGLQSIFNNFVSGVILLFDRSLKVGDFVQLESGVHGEVRDINIRATRITTNDNLDILVPNAEFVSGRVTNWTLRDGFRRLRVPFGVAYGTDKEVVKAAAIEAAAQVPFTLALEGPRRPQVWLVGFGDSSLDFQLVVWITNEATKRPSAVQAAYNWELESALARHGIEIPFPQRDLHLRSGTLDSLRAEDDGAVAAGAPKSSRRPKARGAPVKPGNDAKEDVLQTDALRDEPAAGTNDHAKDER